MVLLDTHVWVWMAVEPKRLSRPASTAIRRALESDGIAIASISLWELAMLFDRGRLRAPGTLESSIARFLDDTHVVVQETTPPIAALALTFAHGFPQDPADRLIGATARALGIPLITRDRRREECALIKTIW